MSFSFIGRTSELAQIASLVKKKQGVVFAISGKPGMGKSTLLRQISERYPKKGQVFIDIDNVSSLQTAVEFLHYFAEHADGLKHTQKALAEINGTFPPDDLIASCKVLEKPLKHVIETQEDESDFTESEKVKVKAIIQILLQLGGVFSKYWQKNKKEKLGNPELYLLNAIRQDCKKHPLIFIDTYERLQAVQELTQQKISSKYSKPHERLMPMGENLSLQEWLERFIPFLKQQGAIIVIAGRKTGKWTENTLERFADEDILNFVTQSDYSDLKALLKTKEKREALLSILKQLSFDGIPLWLRLALNFVSLELKNCTIIELAMKENLNTLFGEPIYESDLTTANIDNADCKLALFQYVMRHNLEAENEAWKIALPRLLDKQVLHVLFGEQTDKMREVFTKAGLLEVTRWTDDTTVRLHEEIRDLLLAYAKYKKWLETEEIKSLHQKLAKMFEGRGISNTEKQKFMNLISQNLSNEALQKGFLDVEITPIYLYEAIYHYVYSETVKLKSYGVSVDYFWRLLSRSFSLNLQEKFRVGIKMFELSSLQVTELIDVFEEELSLLTKLLGSSVIDTLRKESATGNNIEDVKNNPEFWNKEIKNGNSGAWNGLGRALMLQGNFLEAEKAYRRQTEITPNDEHAWKNLVCILVEQDKFSEAEATCSQQIEIIPNHEYAWNVLGDALRLQGKFPEAEAAYRQQIATVPNHEHAWHGLGYTLQLQDNFSEAEIAYRKQTEITPNHEHAWNGLGYVLNRQNKYLEAEVAYRKQTEITPNHEHAWNSLGHALRQQNKIPEAEVAYRQQIAIVPNHEYAWNGLGHTLGLQNKFPEAEAAYRQQTEITPNHEYAWNNLGTELRRGHKFPEAEAAYRRQTEITPNHEDAWDNLGIIYWKQGKLEQAQQAFNQALAIRPQDISTLSNDAELALIQNDKIRCLQRIESALALVDNKNKISGILPFLAWLAEPEQPLDALYQAIEQLDKDVKIDWDFSDTEPAILRLDVTQQALARKFIAYFQGTGDLPPRS